MLDFPDNHNELLQKKYTTIQCLQMAYLEKYRTECFDKFKNAIQKILNKIVKCKYCVVASKKLSNYKGWHIEMYCTRDCDLCRLQFDDIRRYEEDMNRLEVFRNLIFDVKHGF